MAKKKAALAYDFIRNREEQRLLEKYALLFSMEYFLLFKGNYLAISHLYAAMNLYDNEKLIRLLHTQGRGRSYLAGVLGLDQKALHDGSWGDLAGYRPWEHGIGSGPEGSESARGSSEGGREERLSFATQVYEDILRLAADGIVDKHDDNLQSLAHFFIEGAVDEESDPDRLFLQYYHLFRHLQDPAVPDAGYSFARSFYDELFIQKEAAGMKSPSETFAGYLQRGMAGTSFEQGRFLEKTVEDMLLAIARFLNVSGPVRVYSEIRRFHPARLFGTAGVGYLNRQAGLFGDVLAAYHIPQGVFSKEASDWTDRKIRAALEDIVASYYLNALVMQQKQEPQTSKRERPGLAYFPPAPQVLAELYYLLAADSSMGALSGLQEDYYRNFSFDKVTHLETLREMEAALAQEREETKKLREREKRLKERIVLLEGLLEEGNQELVNALHAELASYDRKMEDLERDRDHLKKRNASLEEYIRLMEQAELAGEEDIPGADRPGAGREAAQRLIQEKLPELMTKRLLFLGGDPDLTARLRKVFPAAVFVDNETQQAALSHVDYLVMFTRKMSHALFYKYIEVARSEGIPVIYCNHRNYEMVLQTICEGIE